MIATVIGKDHDPFMVIKHQEGQGTGKSILTSGHNNTLRASQAKTWG
jgi:hypothetical protein